MTLVSVGIMFHDTWYVSIPIITEVGEGGGEGEGEEEEGEERWLRRGTGRGEQEEEKRGRAGKEWRRRCTRQAGKDGGSE